MRLTPWLNNIRSFAECKKQSVIQRISFANLYSIGDFLTTGTSNQIFHYMQHINLKHVASRQSCNCERQGNTVASEKMLQQWQVVGSNVFNLTGPKLEP